MLKMTSSQVVEKSVTANNSSFQNYPNPNDHTIRTTNLVCIPSVVCDVIARAILVSKRSRLARTTVKANRMEIDLKLWFRNTNYCRPYFRPKLTMRGVIIFLNLYANVPRAKRDTVIADIYYYITTEFSYAKCDLRLAAYESNNFRIGPRDRKRFWAKFWGQGTRPHFTLSQHDTFPV